MYSSSWLLPSLSLWLQPMVSSGAEDKWGKGSQTHHSGSFLVLNAFCYLLCRPGASQCLNMADSSSCSQNLLEKLSCLLHVLPFTPSPPALLEDVACLWLLSLTLIQHPQHQVPELKASSVCLTSQWPQLCVKNVNKGRLVSPVRDRACARSPAGSKVKGHLCPLHAKAPFSHLLSCAPDLAMTTVVTFSREPCS